MSLSIRRLPLLILILLSIRNASALDVVLSYYEVQDPDVAEAIANLDDEYDSKEKPLRDERREAGYDTPAYHNINARIDSLREERDQAFLKLLAKTRPTIRYEASASPGQKVHESKVINEKSFESTLNFLELDGDKIPVEIHVEYGERTLYNGSALLLPLGKPFQITKAMAKIQGKRQGTILFIQVSR